MRTKTVILAAAAVAAGALSSQAQNVYSLNVVGYINLTLNHGYTLVANQLVGTDTKLNTVFGTNFPNDGAQVLTWNSATQGFNQPDTYFTAATAGTAGWYDNFSNPSPTTVNPGTGVFFFNPDATTTVTLVGQVTQGATSIPIARGYNFLSVVPPLSVDVATNGGLKLPNPSIDGSQYLTFTTGVGYSQPFTFFTAATAGTAGWYDNASAPAQLIPAVGQAFLIFNNDAPLTWVNTFSVQ